MAGTKWRGVYVRARVRAGAACLADALDHGISASSWYDRVNQEQWGVLGAGIRVVPGAPITLETRRHAALLALGPDALLSHATALDLHGLARRSSNQVVHAVVPYGATTLPPRRTVRHRSRRLDASDGGLVDDFRVTTPARTLLDIAARTSRTRLESLLLSARQRDLVETDEIRTQIARRPSLPGVTRLRRAIAVFEAGPVESILEHRTLELLRRHGLPEPVAQYPVRHRGRTLVVDFAWPDHGVVLECDGRAYHGAEAFQRDRDRWNLIVAAGLQPVWATWADVHDRPDRLVSDLRRKLGV